MLRHVRASHVYRLDISVRVKPEFREIVSTSTEDKAIRCCRRRLQSQPSLPSKLPRHRSGRAGNRTAAISCQGKPGPFARSRPSDHSAAIAKWSSFCASGAISAVPVERANAGTRLDLKPRAPRRRLRNFLFEATAVDGKPPCRRRDPRGGRTCLTRALLHVGGVVRYLLGALGRLLDIARDLLGCRATSRWGRDASQDHQSNAMKCRSERGT